MQDKLSETESNYPQPVGIGLDMATLKSYMPKGFHGQVTKEILEMLNNVERDTGVSGELFSEQLCSYTHLMSGSAGIEKLANAIKYCNLRLLPKMGSARAYRIVFPAKTAEIEARGGDVDSFASQYGKTKMVTEIQKLLLIPVHISHAPMHNAMIKKLFDITNGIGAKADDRVSPTVQLNAAIALMELTKMPEESSIKLDIGLTDGAMSVTQGLMEQVARAADIQMAGLQAGKSIKDVQRLSVNVDDIIEGEVV